MGVIMCPLAFARNREAAAGRPGCFCPPAASYVGDVASGLPITERWRGPPSTPTLTSARAATPFSAVGRHAPGPMRLAARHGGTLRGGPLLHGRLEMAVVPARPALACFCAAQAPHAAVMASALLPYQPMLRLCHDAATWRSSPTTRTRGLATAHTDPPSTWSTSTSCQQRWAARLLFC
jgi:hypothetical protein